MVGLMFHSGNSYTENNPKGKCVQQHPPKDGKIVFDNTNSMSTRPYTGETSVGATRIT
jgi:hypothetical protein